MASDTQAIVYAGVPAENNAFYRRLRFSVGDPASLVELPVDAGKRHSIFILRDIEMHRAKQHARVDHVSCPNDWAPESGLSGDRETATAQATAECLQRHGVTSAVADRALPLIYAEMIKRAGIELECDLDMGVLERRAKDEQEIEWLQEAQSVTEDAIRLACELVANADVNSGGELVADGSVLTSERVRLAVDSYLLQQGYSNPLSIIAGGPTGADCHDVGHGPLRTEQAVIVDIFPQNRTTRYNGDCTRTVVNGAISDELQRMHAAVVAAKQAAIDVTRAGLTGEAVHDATKASIAASGFEFGLPGDDTLLEYCAMTHGTGHGIGLDVHEPPLLDRGGPPLVVGDALTIEPGLYSRAIGGVRVEDMVIVTEDGCINLNKLPEGLAWR